MASSPRMHRTPLRLIAYCSVPVLLIAAGTMGYRWLERWSWFDAFYVAVTTLTSIGYGDRAPLTMAGRVFTMLLALGGIVTVAFAATQILGIIITGELRQFWEGRRMARRIGALQQHVIVCGYGHLGRHVCAHLRHDGVPTVVIDRREASLAGALDAGAHALLGDATTDATLRRAGVERARALIAVAGTDPDNVLITMTARLLCPTLSIVARAEDEATAPRLLRAGATRTVSPDEIVAGRMAQAVLRPAGLELLEDAARREHLDLRMEEELVGPGSPFDGKTVGASGLRARLGRILVAIRRPDGRVAFNPGDDASVVAGDTLIMLAGAGNANR